MALTLLWVVNIAVVAYCVCGYAAVISALAQKDRWRRVFLTILPVLGPAILGIYWKTQNLFRLEDAVFFSRIMAGDSARMLGIASIGLIAGGGLALGALSLGKRFFPLLVGAACVSLSWFIVKWHPTPHYVPLTEPQDNAVWFVLLVGGSILCLAVYILLKKRLVALQTPLTILAGLVAMLSAALLPAHIRASVAVDLKPLAAAERIRALGCLACHTMDGLGQEEPGGQLESVASRSEDVVLAFMLEPTAEKAKELKIRTAPTGEMAGVHLTEEEAKLVTEAMTELFEIKPPSIFGAGYEDIEAIIVEQNCLACHSVKGEGAPDGGLGRSLEESAARDRDVLVEWLMYPVEETALRLGIRTSDEYMGAMEGIPLPKEQAERFADWLKTLEPME